MINRAFELQPSNSLEYAWDVLERFGQVLQDCNQAHEQVRLALDAARETLDADAVFWYPGNTGEMFEQVGCPVLSEGWARDFLAHGAHGERAVRHFLDPAAKPVAPWPASAAMVRISRVRGSWLVALSFHPRRLFNNVDLKILLLTRRILLNHRRQVQTCERLRESLIGLVRCLTSAIDARDPFRWGHSERVARVALRLARQMGLPSSALQDVYLAGLLHDIGKLGIRAELMLKPCGLTPQEFEHIKQHVVIGDRLVSNLGPLQHLRPGVRWHHERWDGQGYPDGLVGEKIPLIARIVAVADACDAMMATRPYRGSLSPSQIDDILLQGAGAQWDPDIIAILMTCRDEIYAICQSGLKESILYAVEGELALDPNNVSLNPPALQQPSRG